MSSSSYGGSVRGGVSQNEVQLNVDPDRHNTSRISHLSHGSQISMASTIQLGGVDYNVGTRVGKSFVIGDPHATDPFRSRDSLNSTKTGISHSTGNSKKQLTKDAYPVVDKGYNFEYWNWSIIRFLCFGFVVIVMLCLLGAVIGLVVGATNRCLSPFKWWQGSLVYKISVPHYYDMDNDANKLGDLKGVMDKISYLKYLDAEVIILSNFLTSSVEDGWDPVDSFKDVDRRLGRAADFSNLVSELHKENKKVLLSFNPAYTSPRHKWFRDSSEHSASYKSPMEQFYIWSSAPKTGYDGSWEFNVERNMYYLHKNESAEKAILDWNQYRLHEEFESAMEYWLKGGVDGFAIENMDQIHVSSETTVLSILSSWRDLLDRYSTDDADRKILVVGDRIIRQMERGTDEALVERALEQVDLVQAQLNVNFNNFTYGLQDDAEKALRWQSRVGGPWVQWQLGDLARLESRYYMALMFYLMMLPGTPSLVAGQEIGLISQKGPMFWRSGSIFPYQPGSMLNETTLEQLKKLSNTRQNKFSLRHDSVPNEDSDGSPRKSLTLSYPHIDKQLISVKRRYKVRDAYIFMANLHREPVTHDWFGVAAGGDIVAGSNVKLKGYLDLKSDLTLQPGQVIVFVLPF